MELKGFSHFQVIAEGGMAVLYRATQISLDRPVAIKVMKAALLETPQARNMFERESQIVARLDHPHIIRVIDKGLTSDDMPYFVMDFVEGEPLNIAIKSGKLTTSQKLRVSIQVAKALAYAHKNNIVHRDIKPGNILIDKEENARVVDFGIALITEDAEMLGHEAGLTVGTLSYMAPEQHNGASFATAASDVYSLGVMMYLMFGGIVPKPGYPPPSHYNPKVTEEISNIVMSCLSEEPAARPPAEKLTSMLLKSVQGEHLTPSQVEDAKETFKDPKEKFRLLDVIRETPFGSACLYENRLDHTLMVLKKRIGSFKGFQEAEWLAKNRHPNIINILGVSKNERIFIVVMEYLQGGSLQNFMAQPMSVAEFIPIAEQICDAMTFAHQNHIIHGNLRPHNVLLDEDNQIKVTDFGFDKHYQATDEPDWYSIEDEPLSEKYDIFSAGVLFYQLLTGNTPQWKKGIFFPHETFQQLPHPLQSLLKTMIFRDLEIRVGAFEEVKARLQDKSFRPVLTPRKTGTEESSTPSSTDGSEASASASSQAPARKRRLAFIAALLISINVLLFSWLILGKGNLGDAAQRTWNDLIPSSKTKSKEAWRNEWPSSSHSSKSTQDEGFLQPVGKRSAP